MFQLGKCYPLTLSFINRFISVFLHSASKSTLQVIASGQEKGGTFLHQIKLFLKPVTGMNIVITTDLYVRDVIIAIKETLKISKRLRVSSRADKIIARGTAQDNRKRIKPKNPVKQTKETREGKKTHQ